MANYFDIFSTMNWCCILIGPSKPFLKKEKTRFCLETKTEDFQGLLNIKSVFTAREQVFLQLGARNRNIVFCNIDLQIYRLDFWNKPYLLFLLPHQNKIQCDRGHELQAETTVQCPVLVDDSAKLLRVLLWTLKQLEKGGKEAVAF